MKMKIIRASREKREEFLKETLNYLRTKENYDVIDLDFMLLYETYSEYKDSYIKTKETLDKIYNIFESTNSKFEDDCSCKEIEDLVYEFYNK